MVYGKETDSHQPPCECDRSRGYYGDNYYNCEILDKPCDAGLELSARGMYYVFIYNTKLIEKIVSW